MSAREIIGYIGLVGMAITGPRMIVAAVRAGRALHAYRQARKRWQT